MSTRASRRGLTAADLKDQLHDIQDNVVAPILMRYGRHVFVKFTDGAKARAWLRNMSVRVNARQEERGTRFTVNIGFTYEGLKAIGLSRPSLESFPEAFRVGMRGRARVVGDVGPHAPEHWEGGLGGPDIHAMALLRTDSDHGREEAMRIFRAEMEATGGVEIRFVQDTMALAHENGIGSEGEHFGFADPISQPPIEGADAPSYPGDGVLQPDGTWRPVKPGEFLLGYEDEAGPEGTQAPEPPELRLNGTLCGLPQAVSGRGRVSSLSGDGREGALRFRRRSPSGAGGGQDDGALAAAGARSICRPTRTIPRSRRILSAATTSPMPATMQGRRCPLGSHLRRSNPRATPLKRATAVQRHRLLRRGVEYGPHLAEGALEDDGVDRGLINLFIQADIERQFEFVQKEWMKGGEFIGLDPSEQDPINGVGGEGSQMSVPGAKRPFLFDLPTFIRVKGGEYLFAPGLKALEGLIEQKF